MEPSWRPHLSETQRRRTLPPRTAARPLPQSMSEYNSRRRIALSSELLTLRPFASLSLNEWLVPIARISLAANFLSVQVSQSRPLPARSPRPLRRAFPEVGRPLPFPPSDTHRGTSVRPGLPNRRGQWSVGSARKRCSAARNASSHGPAGWHPECTMRAVRVIRPGT